MDLFVNGEQKQLKDGASLHDLVAEMGLLEKRIAIEVNEEIIPRSQHAEYSLQAQDKVEIVHAIGGG